MNEGLEYLKFQSDVLGDLNVDKKSVRNPRILTKSKFLNGLQCPKLLWTRCNAPEQIPEPSSSLQRVFDVGNLVGKLATKRFPGGIHVDEDDFLKNIKDTQKLLAAQNPKPIYEAGISSGRLYARADILVPSGTVQGAWDVVEVKCGTEVKDVYLEDIAFQRHCYEEFGLKVGRCYLMHINNEYVRKGEIDVNEFFSLVDVTEAILPFLQKIPDLIRGLLKVIDLPVCPNISIREYCSKPYDCQMEPLCWAFLPEENVLELSRGKPKGFDLLECGVMLLKDIPDEYKLTDNQRIQRQCAVSGQAYLDSAAIATFLRKLTYPIYFMDFETVFDAIPRFDGTHPYQQVPFQFSVHVQKAPGAALEHFAFLQKSSDDPRCPFLEALKTRLGNKGTILAYNMSFEKGCITDLAEAFPASVQWCHDVVQRMEDLYAPFRSFFYYHPRQRGSASIKKVLPALVGKGYEGMGIAEGGQASEEYSRVTYGSGVGTEDRERVYADLEAYCALDTKAMVDILDRLKNLVENTGKLWL